MAQGRGSGGRVAEQRGQRALARGPGAQREGEGERPAVGKGVAVAAEA